MLTVGITDLVWGAGVLVAAGICIGIWLEYLGHAIHHDHKKGR